MVLIFFEQRQNNYNSIFGMMEKIHVRTQMKIRLRSTKRKIEGERVKTDKEKWRAMKIINNIGTQFELENRKIAK